MHSSQAPTMLDFAIIMRNAVWIKVKFCKINDILRDVTDVMTKDKLLALVDQIVEAQREFYG